MRDTEAMIADAFPRDVDGHLLCGHCGAARDGAHIICPACWFALSAFTRQAILHASSAAERAAFVVASRPNR